MSKRRKRVFYINRNYLSLRKLTKVLIIVLLMLVIGSIYFMQEFFKTSDFLFLVLFLFCILFSVILFYTIARIITIYKIKNKYKLTLKKIKLKYYNFLEYKKYNFNNNKYRNIIETTNLKELIYLSKKSGFKIKYFESVPGEKCYFLLEYNNTLYKYILTKY